MVTQAAGRAIIRQQFALCGKQSKGWTGLDAGPVGLRNEKAAGLAALPYRRGQLAGRSGHAVGGEGRQEPLELDRAAAEEATPDLVAGGAGT